MTKATEPTPKTEQLEFVLDFWDVPIEGIAVNGGQAFYFRALFDEARDAYSGTYDTTAISESTRLLAKQAAYRWRTLRRAENPRDRLAWEVQLKALRDALEIDRLKYPTRQIAPRFVRISDSINLEEAFKVIWPCGVSLDDDL